MTRLQSFFLFFFSLLFVYTRPSSCFTGISVPATSPTTRLQYQDDKHSESPTKKQAVVPTMPILGPFLNQPPLMIGAEMTLTTPTPLQWQSLEEAFYRHQQHLSDDDSKDGGVSAAPLVAILDQTNDMNNHGSQGRYATIAAVVGVSSSLSGSDETINTDNNSAFMESIAGARGNMIDHAKVRLVGVGRAVLKDFMYQVPTSIAEKAMDEEGHLLTTEHGERLVGDEDEDDDEEEGPPVNVIIAQFVLVSDVLSSRAASPTHAVTNMGRLANQVEWLHQDRRNLVAGLKAANARLEKAEQKRAAALLDALEDHDGLGLLFGGEAVSASNDDLVVETKKPKKKSKLKKKPNSPVEKANSDSSSTMQDAVKPAETPVSEPRSPLLTMENYGLGSSASSLTGLKELTQVLLEKLAPYYSPKRCASEEHYYEVYSFAAVLAMDSYVLTPSLTWSLRSVNTEQRLQRTYEWMTAHVAELKKEAEWMSRALQDCGEECTDLF